MRRSAVVAILLVCVAASGCNPFASKKQPLPGERISVLSLDRQLKPDPALASTPISLPRPVVNRDWPQPGGFPNHAMQHLALPSTLHVAWKTSVGEGSSRYTQVLAQPVVVAGRVYAMDGGSEVSAYDAANGQQIWQVDVTPSNNHGSSFGGGVAYWKGRLYVSSGYARVLALDPKNGKVIWKTDVDAPVRSGPTVTDGRVYVVTVENELIALAADDGRRLWSHSGIPETATLVGSASPAVEGEVVVVGYSSGEIDALTVENGRLLWSDNLASVTPVDAVSALADIRGRPVIDRGRVYGISHAGRMAAIDIRDGERVWEQDIGSSHGPWVAGDYVYVLSNDNELICLTRDGGKVRWLRQLPSYEDEKNKEDPIIWAGPVLGGDRLIVLSSDGWALSVSPYTGNPLGREQIAGDAFVDPVIANDTLYILTDNGELAAYR
ncbi:MAG TPA: PQQ-binding-like beta-propeller repeat protein [Stellaceae bacterium]|nr:PQQ-binding-like beta-propeller repeat protein [Stellaceae bacterium]